jgi:hypothetical protein
VLNFRTMTLPPVSVSSPIYIFAYIANVRVCVWGKVGGGRGGSIRRVVSQLPRSHKFATSKFQPFVYFMLINSKNPFEMH